ncbi:Association with the SNF1 complex (ASC) domain [Dillenia turbinata]|uniref:Association with the SNF1 complex (ASC) domain n=1 Tax=Dillenia turbinata TaxID=194707 RepID=A0AAN8ZJZ3_9MAGN
MGNVNGGEEGGGGEGNVSGEPAGRVSSSDYITANNTPPDSPGRSRSPFLFTPQVPVVPLQRGNGPPLFNKAWHDESHGSDDLPLEHGIPTLITWNYGGDDVAVEGSWDNWRSRKKLQRAGKDYSILLVLPSGIYHYKFLVDGEWRHIPDLPFVSDELGNVCNLLDVNDYVPENLESVSEFEVPESPDSSYCQAFPAEEDFAKEPVVVPPQLHLTVLGMQNQEEASTSKPQHVVLNHLFIEKGWASQSVAALGLTHRYQSKYVTVVLYKPVKRFSNAFSGFKTHWYSELQS